VDDQNPEQVLPDFLTRIRDAGVRRVSIHARKAWLQGLSPKENRDIPPLDYALVHRMKEAFGDMHVSLNGGLATLEAAVPHLDRLDGVMIGRAAYHQPWDILGRTDSVVFDKPDPLSEAAQAARAMLPYIEAHLSDGGRLHQVTRHMLGLFAGRPGARGWRRCLSDGVSKPGAGPELVERALNFVEGHAHAAQ